MSMQETAPERPISKAEFARRRQVSKARVSQWLDEGKISRPALVGEGREQQIIESIACDQLKKRLDTAQRLSGNGLATRLDAPAPVPSQAQPQSEPQVVLPFPPKGSDAVADQIARERLEQIQRVNRREAVEEAAEAGRLTETAVAAQSAGRQAAQMVNLFEGALASVAAAVAARFELPQRDVLHLLRGEFRNVRAAAAAALRREAEALPALVPIELETTAPDDDPDRERRAAGDGSDGEGVATPAAG